MNATQEIYIGEKSGSQVDKEFLGSLLRGMGPRWFDGTHFYALSGKYELQGSDMTFLHNLSFEGILNHFEPCEYTAYNQDCLEAYEKYTRENEQKAQALAEKKEREQEASRQENLRWQARADTINSWIDSKKTRGKKGDYLIAAGEGGQNKRWGTIFGHLAFAANDDGKGYTVTHIPTGYSIGSFNTQKECRRYIFAMNAIYDWAKEPEPGPLYSIFRLFRKFTGHYGMETEEIDELADFVESLEN